MKTTIIMLILSLGLRGGFALADTADEQCQDINNKAL